MASVSQVSFARADVLARLLARLPAHAALAALTSRDLDDPAIAVLDAWAGVLDVVSFYLDRIVEEGYLGTAREPRSVLELARTAGYELRPGLAATVGLAFGVATQPGLPATVTIPAGVKIQAIPGPDQQPQVFETVEDLVARPEWNSLRIAPPDALPIAVEAAELPLSAPAAVRPGDSVLVVGATAAQRYAPAVAQADGLLVRLSAPLRTAHAGTAEPVPPVIDAPAVFTLPTRLRLYGHDAPPVPDERKRRAGGLYRYDPVTDAWTRLHGDLPSVPVTAVAALRRDDTSLIWAALDGRGLYRSADLGTSWQPVGTGLAGRSVCALCADPAGVLFAGGDDGAVFRSRDDGDTWQQVTQGGALERRVYRQRKPGTTGQSPADYDQAPLPDQVVTASGLPRARVYALAARDGRVFAATDDGVFRSTDGALTWNRCLGEPGARSLAVTDARLVVAATAGGRLAHGPVDLADPGAYILEGSGGLGPRVPRAIAVSPGPPPANPAQLTWYGIAIGADDLLLPAGLMGPVVGLPAPGVRALAVDGQGGLLVALAPGAPIDDDWPSLAPVPGQDWVDLDRLAGDVTAGRWLVLTGAAGVGAWPVVATSTVTRADVGPAVRLTRVRLGAGPPLDRFLANGGVRGAEVLLSGAPLALATGPIGGGRIVLDGPIPPLPPGRRLVVTGGDPDAGGENAVAAGMPDDRTIVLAAPLRNRYPAGSIEIRANVAPATHGTAVDAEVLGSGDVTAAHQRFTLSQAPLTYLPAPTGSGARDTLVVSVDGVPWREVAALRDSGPRDEVYLARRDGDGRTEVVFGDGVRGARPRTGVDNVTAGYRCGLGSAGNVLPHSLVLMQTRPLGVQEVTNPLPATGGADAETGVEDSTRLRRRLLAVDRLVTPADFEQFAAAFAGIAAAQATALSASGAALLHLTVAGLDGQPVPIGSPLHDSLVEAIDQRRPRGPAVRVESYQPLPLAVAARLLVDRRHDPAAVAAEAERSVRATFAVGGRDLGRPVRRGELIALLQNVAGVLAVDLDRLSLDGDPPAPQRVVPCHRARWAAGAVLPAELLVAGTVELTAGWVPG